MPSYDKYERKGCAKGLRDHVCPPAGRKCAYRRAPCEEPSTDITFWLDARGKMKDGSLPSDNTLALLFELIKITAPWMAASALIALGWICVLPDDFEPSMAATAMIIAAMVTAVYGYWSTTDAKRVSNAQAYIGLVSASKNHMNTVVNSVDVAKLAANPMVEVRMHNSSGFVLVKVPALAVVKWMAVCHSGLLAAQRNALRRGSIDIAKLPLYNPQKAELAAYKNTIDPIEQLQGMVLRYAGVLIDAGLASRELWQLEFHKDNTDSAGNVDINGKVNISAVNALFSYIVRIMATILLPMQFAIAFPGYSAVWITPLVMYVYYALNGIADRQTTIAVSQAKNFWTSIKLTDEMRTGAQTCYARAMQVANMVAAEQLAKTGKVTMPPPPPEAVAETPVGPPPL